MRNCMTRALYERNDGARWKDKGEGEPFGHTLRAHSWDGVACGGRFKRSLAEWIILFHGGANTSITATRILSGLWYESRIRRFVREEWKGWGRRRGGGRESGWSEQPACSPVPDVKLFRDSRPPEKSSMRRTRPWSESRMRRFSVAEITRRSDLRPTWALSMNE